MRRWIWMVWIPRLALGDSAVTGVVSKPGTTMTIDAVVAYAVRHNPDLEAARWSVDQAKARLAQAGRWSSPELETEFRPNVEGREGSLSVGVTQRVPLAGRLRAGRARSQAELMAVEAEIQDAERRVVEQVRLLTIQGLAFSEQGELKDRQIANSRALAEAARRAVAAGEAPTTAAAQFELEVRQLELDRMRLEGERAAVLVDLRTWLGWGSDTPLELEGPLPEPEGMPGMDPPPAQRPDFQAAEARSEAAREGIAVARASRWADVGVGLFGEVERLEDRPVGLEDEAMVGLRLSVPLPVWGRFRGQIDEAAATAARADQEAMALGNRIRGEARVARVRMQVALRQASEIARELLPAAQDLEGRLLAAHQRGEAPLGDVLRARDRRLALEAAAIDARRDYQLARIRYESSVGLGRSPGSPVAGSGRRPGTPSPRRGRRRRSRASGLRGGYLGLPGLLSVLLVFLVTSACLGAARGEEGLDRGRFRDPAVVLDEATIRNLRLETAPVERRAFEETVFALGRIRVAPGHRALVSSRIQGRAAKVTAHIDTRVEADEALVVVESRLPGDPPPHITLRAPMAGLIATMNVVPGQPISPEDSLIEIVDLGEVHAVAAVPEHRVGLLKLGNRSRLRVSALPGREFEAELAHFGAEVDATSGTLEAAFHVENPDYALRPGMRGEFSIVVASRPDVLVVPREAVQGDLGNRSVFVRDPERPHAFHRVSVILGQENDRVVEVREGLREGELVVSRGGYSLAFAGREAVSVRAALDAAHGHEHNEDGSEKKGSATAGAGAGEHAEPGEGSEHDHDHEGEQDHDHDHHLEHGGGGGGEPAGSRGSSIFGGEGWTGFLATASVLMGVLLILSERRYRSLRAEVSGRSVKAGEARPESPDRGGTSHA